MEKTFNQKGLKEFFEELDSKLKREITIYLVGGGAMCFRGLKGFTKDVDFVLMNKKDYFTIKKTLESMKFEYLKSVDETEFYGTPVWVFMRDKERVDIFIKSVCNALEFSRSMKKRAEPYGRFKHINLQLTSNEDIFLFKSITNRDKDVEDGFSLVGQKLKWKIIKKELQQQEKKAVWRFWVYEQVCRIENKYNKKIELKNYLWKLVKKKWDKRPEDFMEDIKDKNFEKEIAK